MQFTAEVWADNWFSLYVNGQKVAEDSEPITQVRSFNAEPITFTATYPLTIAMVTKDYTEGNSGLEYIGTPNQQMGDGGFIAQFTETATGKVVAATNDRWQGLVVQRAPLNQACVTSSDPNTTCTYETKTEPDGWTEPRVRRIRLVARQPSTPRPRSARRAATTRSRGTRPPS